ncbi:MAG: hypothetical protein Q4B14_03425 [Clostridia bacterium]|nr:hypothetical protein [Clostridia bacterium]
MKKRNPLATKCDRGLTKLRKTEYGFRQISKFLKSRKTLGGRKGANFAYDAFISTETPFEDLLKES